jgi:hypothetical protein
MSGEKTKNMGLSTYQIVTLSDGLECQQNEDMSGELSAGFCAAWEILRELGECGAAQCLVRVQREL